MDKVQKHNLFNTNNHHQNPTEIIDVQLFRIAVCDTDHYLVVAEIMERVLVSK
jgi:hypothetical protein